MEQLAALESEKKHSAGGKIGLFLSKGAKIILILVAVRIFFKTVSRCFKEKK